jgi:spoIIIJ-associated protein
VDQQMTHGENGNRQQGQRRRRPYNKRRRPGNRANGNREKNGNKAQTSVEKNGNYMEPEANGNFAANDSQSQLLPQSVTVTASDFTQATQEAMLKLNIHDESLLSHEILEKGKRSFLGVLGSREVTYKFSIVPKIDVMAQAFLENLVRLSLLDVTFELSQQENLLEISFEGDDEEVLKANGFEVVTCFEQLLRKHLIKKAALRNSFKFVITVAGEVNSREAKLENLATKMRDKLLKNKKPVTLNSMSPRDRRIIHQFFSEDEEVNTKSFGDGYYKRIKLYLKRKNDDVTQAEETTLETQETQAPEQEVTTTSPEESNANVAISEEETNDNIGNV